MKLIFGAITCDSRKQVKSTVTREIRIRKTPSTTGRVQTVFIPQEFQSLVNQEARDEDLAKGLLCESPPGHRQGQPNHDIALIRLDHPLSEDDLRYETTNINTICIEHSKKVPFTVMAPLTAFAAGFGIKGNYGPNKADDKLVDGPELSFLKYSIYQSGAFSVSRPYGPSSQKKVLLNYDINVANEEQFALSLDDDERRDTAEVSF